MASDQHDWVAVEARWIEQPVAQAAPAKTITIVAGARVEVNDAWSIEFRGDFRYGDGQREQRWTSVLEHVVDQVGHCDRIESVQPRQRGGMDAYSGHWA